MEKVNNCLLLPTLWSWMMLIMYSKFPLSPTDMLIIYNFCRILSWSQLGIEQVQTPSVSSFHKWHCLTYLSYPTLITRFHEFILFNRISKSDRIEINISWITNGRVFHVFPINFQAPHSCQCHVHGSIISFHSFTQRNAVWGVLTIGIKLLWMHSGVETIDC